MSIFTSTLTLICFMHQVNALPLVHMAGNLFGTCLWETTKEIANNSAQKFFVTFYPPSNLDLSIRRAKTLTKSSKSLGVGMIAGKPQGVAWANSTFKQWGLSSEHPRANRSDCLKVTIETGFGAKDLYEDHTEQSPFYLVESHHSLIHESGTVALPCGYFHSVEACETTNPTQWWNACVGTLIAQKIAWPTQPIALEGASIAAFNHSTCTGKVTTDVVGYLRVFVVSAQWDSNLYHFLMDSLSRLVHHLDFLIANPDIKIHVRRFEHVDPTKPASAEEFRCRIASLLGLDCARFVSGVVFAQHVFLPRAMKCAFTLAHAAEIRYAPLYSKRECSIQCGLNEWVTLY